VRYIKPFLLICLLIITLLCGCSNTESKHIKIAVLGDKESFYPTYEDGINRAVLDLNEEYGDMGYTFECVFYDDNNDYNTGMKFVDDITGDEDVTAVIASLDMEINKTSARICEENEKVFVVPYFLYDSVYTENNYNFLFSMCNSSEHVGMLLRRAAADSGLKRWAICSRDAAFENSEIKGFLSASNDGVTVVDSASVSDMNTHFDEVYARWETLGVEGVIILPHDGTGFEMVKKLREKNSTLIIGSDTSFDNSSIYYDTSVILHTKGVFLVEEFPIRTDFSDEEYEKFNEIIDVFVGDETGVISMWYVQGYNAVRMIGDTAVKCGSSTSTDIAQRLHSEGYDGVLSTYRFKKNGALENMSDYYNVHNHDGTFERVYIND